MVNSIGMLNQILSQDNNNTSAYHSLTLNIRWQFRLGTYSTELFFLALMSSDRLPVLVFMAPIYLKEFTLAIVSPSTFAFSSPTTSILVFRAFTFSSLGALVEDTTLVGSYF